MDRNPRAIHTLPADRFLGSGPFRTAALPQILTPCKVLTSCDMGKLANHKQEKSIWDKLKRSHMGFLV